MLKLVFLLLTLLFSLSSPAMEGNAAFWQSSLAAERTTAENKAARDFFKNHKDEARQGWEQRTGKDWPTDANGKALWHTPAPFLLRTGEMICLRKVLIRTRY